MNPLTLLRCVGLSAALPSLVLAQQTLIVDRAGGPGVYADLPAAEAAAQPGDTLLVRAGVDYTPITTSKGITILGEGNPNFGPTFGQPFTVVNLPAGQRFVLKGMVLAATPAGIGALRIDSCLGRVHVENVVATAAPGASPAPAVEVLGCQAVTLTGGTFTGAPGLVCRSSTVAVAAVVITGLGTSASSPTPVPAEGATIDASFVQFTNPQVSGGRAAAAGNGAPGLVLLSGVVVLAQNGPAFVAAGTGGAGDSAVVGTGLLTTDPRIALVPSGAAPPVSGVTVVTQRNGAVRAHSAPPGSPVVVDLDAPQGDLFVLLAGRTGDALSSPLGTLWLHPGLLFFLGSGVMDATEHVTQVLSIPPEVSLGFPLAFQALTGFGLTLSTPAVAVLW